jgi:amino acid adenylation domain-containing protein
LAVTEKAAATEENRSEVLKKIAIDESAKPIDIAHGPLWRVILVKFDRDSYGLILILHHIVADGWSMQLFLQELTSIYSALESSAPARLPELPIQYADFTVWQREQFAAGKFEPQMKYWRRQLEGRLPVLQLLTDRPRPRVQTYRGAREYFEVPGDVFQSLSEFSRGRKITLFTILMAAYQTLLHRYTGDIDLLVGTPVAGRNRAETENLIGLLVNTLVIRASFASGPTFAEIVSRVREALLEAFSHQDLPLDILIKELVPTRDLSHSPLFQTMFVLQDAPIIPRLGGLAIRSIEVDTRTSKFDLSLSITNGDSRLTGAIEYNTDLFDGSTVSRMLRHFLNLLEGAAADPDRRVSELPLFTPEENRQILHDWNRTEINYPKGLHLHELFEEQARRRSERIAVTFGDAHLSYGELDREANRLANYLLELGLLPDTPVAVSLNRSTQLVIALLAVLKAGGAYLPIDSSYPPERLAFMLDDARCNLLLSSREAHDRLPANPRCAHRVDLDADRLAFAQRPADKPACHLDPANMAYVIYTSGSTGQPKGVINTHEAICNRLLWMQEQYRLGAADVVLQKTPASFDVSVWEFFWPLMAGARMALAAPGGHKDGAYLARLIADQQVTVLHFVPAMLQLFLDEPGLEKCGSLRTVICSGEALPAESVERFQNRLKAGLHNLYGPTEAAVDVTYWECDPAAVAETRSVPIGRPIANTGIYLLDESLRPVPIAAPGELHIGGTGLARGYLNRANLTAERFIPNSFASAGGARLYRTGDLAYFRPDGLIEFLGRADGQVKIRGHRIELAEIESALNTHPSVKEAVVVVRPGQAGTNWLVAYIVARREAPVWHVDRLRNHLRERLPDYMIPSVFSSLETAPLTPSGKIDRRSLPEVDKSRPALFQDYVAPSTPTEEMLAQIWRELLGLSRVGVNDNFFDLGGHSLLLVQAQNKIKQVFGRDLSVVELFDFPTINSLAAHLCQLSGNSASDEVAERARKQKASRRKQMERLLHERFE